MAPEQDRLTRTVDLGSVVFKQRSFAVEFKLRLNNGEQRILKYSERKNPDDSLEYVGLEIDLGRDLAGNIFKTGDADPVGSVFSRAKISSIPFGKSLGDLIRERYDSASIRAFIDYLNREEYDAAVMLWKDALSI